MPSLKLRTFISDMRDVAGRHSIIPQSIKTALEQRLEVVGSFDRLYDYMFFDDARNPQIETWKDCAGAEELVRRAYRIADRSNDCSRMLSDESAWNNMVHSPLLEMFVYDMRDAPGQDVLDFVPW